MHYKQMRAAQLALPRPCSPPLSAPPRPLPTCCARARPPLPPSLPQVVKASVPLSEMFNYVSTLRGMTKVGGREGGRV